MKTTKRNHTKNSAYALSCLLILVLVCALLFASCAASELDMRGEMMNGAANDSYSGITDSSISLDGSKLPEQSGEYARKIIKTVRIDAETRDFDTATVSIEALCTKAGGYIESSSVRGTSLYNGKNSRSANYTLRIPAGELDAFHEEVGGLLNVVSSTSNADEVTSTYYDIKSRIEVLEMQKASLQEMYDNYTDYKDINSLISLQDKLFDVIEEIEAYQTQIRLYDDKIAYSTVHLSLSEVVEYTEEKEEETFLTQMWNALRGGWEFVVNVCRGLAIAIAAVLPFALSSGLVVFLIVILCVSSAKRKRAKRARAQEQQNHAE